MMEKNTMMEKSTMEIVEITTATMERIATKEKETNTGTAIKTKRARKKKMEIATIEEIAKAMMSIQEKKSVITEILLKDIMIPMKRVSLDVVRSI